MELKDIEEFEANVEKQHLENQKLLDMFESWLKDKGLVSKTIQSHLQNVDFYINDFLNYYDINDVKTGCIGYRISSFLGDWFIRKAMWSSPASVKSNAASIKKFYACLLEQTDLINKEHYIDMCATIKEEISEWMENAAIDDDMEYMIDY